jgi:NDP-sugar pyrophosphorylase family protein
MASPFAHPEHITAVIPAAGRVAEGLVGLSNIVSPAMIPVGGRPVIYWTLRHLHSLGIHRAVVAVARRGTFIEEFVACTKPNMDVDFLTPTNDSGVLRTVLDLLEQVRTPSALVVLGDTHFRLPANTSLPEQPVVLVRPVDDAYRFCVAQLHEGAVTQLVDKPHALVGEQHALIGVYYFPDVEAARTIARNCVLEAESAGRSPQLLALLEQLSSQSGLRAVVAEEWSDVGNPDRQAASHRALLQQRAFNELAIDPVFGTITKRSHNVSKFIDEINYVRLLPDDLGVLFPRIVAHSTSWNAPFVTMEYYGYPTLSEMWVYENIDPAIWRGVFHHLHSVITEGFGKHQRPIEAEAVREMLLGKTAKRLTAITTLSPLYVFAHGEKNVWVNDVSVPSLRQQWPRLERAIDELAARATGTIIHGDLCFSNILYDLRSRVIKLLDPRGSFGDTGIYGDPRYDLAKLHHSVIGGYDLLVNDLFDVSVEADVLHLSLRQRHNHRAIAEQFESVFFGVDKGPLRTDITLISGLLFASMIPLHADMPRRQLAMMARALQLLEQGLQQWQAHRGQA